IVGVYGVLPLNRLILLATSEELQLEANHAASGNFGYQITYEKLDKTGGSFVIKKAPYVLFGYAPNTIQLAEIYYNNISQDQRRGYIPSFLT
ncbi:MAG TPA: hypothetical protein VN456_05150, partial [Desulfosporosinus sp.]|nr:hypothetical protein [Desulfosporosinus sp.]